MSVHRDPGRLVATRERGVDSQVSRPRSFLLLGLLLFGAGCHPSSSDVFVDLDKAVLPRTRVNAPAIGRAPTKLPSATTYTIPAAPQVTESRSVAEGAAKVAASIKANRDKTYKAIVRRLHDAYVREADAIRAQQLAAFEPVRAKTMADALQRVSKAYLAYADAVGPKVAKLAVNAGFPDPDKQGKRKPSGAEGLDVLAYETAQQLRADIAKLKADFKRFSDTTIRSASADVDAKLTDVLNAVDRQVGDIDARAESVASHEVSQAQANLGALLADKPPAPLPAVPESRVVVHSVNVPTVTPPPATDLDLSDTLAKARQDLKIWLAVNRYVLQRKGQGRDATAEFIEWRNRFKQEPSARP